MTERTEIELNSMERRLNAVRMTDSKRLVAMAAMRKGFIIVERFAWLAHKITQIGATLFSKPRLAKPSAYSAEGDRRFRSNVTANSGAR